MFFADYWSLWRWGAAITLLLLPLNSRSGADHFRFLRMKTGLILSFSCFCRRFGEEKRWALSGSSCGDGGVGVDVVVVEDAGFAAGACAAGVGVDARAGASLAIASLPLLLGRVGGTGLLLPLNLPGFGAELLPNT